MALWLCIVLIFALVITLLASQCPTQFCFAKDRIILSNLKSKEELSKVADTIRHNSAKKWEIRNLHLEGGLPRNVFTSTKLETLILRDFTLRVLSEDHEKVESPFDGIEKTLKHLIILNSTDGIGWDWHELSRLEKLERLIIGDGTFAGNLHTHPMSNFTVIGGEYNQIKWLQITGSCMMDMVSIQKFSKIERLELMGNKITQYDRKWLPDPANNLEVLDLSNNKITTITKGAFKHMDNLKNVSFANNLITKFLSVNPLPKTVLHFNVYGNYIHCDTSIRWIISYVKPEGFIFEDGKQPLMCSAPEGRLAGKLVSELSPGDLKMPEKAANEIPITASDYLPPFKCRVEF